MASTLAQNGTVPNHPFSLHNAGTAGDAGEQMALSPQMDWQEKGARIRKLLQQAIVANQITMPEIERNTGVDEKQAARSLKEGGGAHPPMPLVAYLLWNDERAVILTGIANALGYEIRRRADLVYEENRRLKARLEKLEAAFREVEP